MNADKLLSRALIVLVVLLPASTYAKPPQADGDMDLKVRGQHFATHVERHQKVTRVAITSADGDTASFVVDGRTITFSDGTIIRNTFVSRGEELVVNVEVGNLASIYHYNIRSGQGFVTGDAAGIAAAVANSHDIQLLRQVLPAMAEKIQAQRSASRTLTLKPDALVPVPEGLTPEPDSFWGCAGAVLTMVAADIGVIIGCGTPEPLEPAVCGMALFAWAGAAANVLDQCY